MGCASATDIPVIAEEEVAAGHAVGHAGSFWLVDPLDGTREFAAGREDFTVNIGLVRDGAVVLGAVALPAYGELYLGDVGAGRAIRRDASGEHRIQVRTAPPRASRCWRRATTPTTSGCAPGLAPSASPASAISARRRNSCASPRAAPTCNPRLGRTMEWDTAAPQAVVEAAGGSVCLFDGSPLRYAKPGWENPHFICRGAT